MRVVKFRQTVNNAWSNVLGVAAFAGCILTIGFAGGSGWCWGTVLSCAGTLLCALFCANADASARYWSECEKEITAKYGTEAHGQ